MGCGRVGSTLALGLEAQGHDVAVIDQDPAAFRRLGSEFDGRRVTGMGFDRDTLVKAGIEHAYAFAAVSSGDNSNIIAARVARETFGVEHVVARIYDSRRAEIFERLGIPTVATVAWTAAEILHRMLPGRDREEWRDSTGHIGLGEFPMDAGWIGMRYAEVGIAAGVTIAVVNRFGDGIRLHPDLVVQQDDQLRVLYELTRVDEVADILGSPPEERT